MRVVNRKGNACRQARVHGYWPVLFLRIGTKCLFPELLQYSLAPPFTPDAVLEDSSANLSLQTTLHGGGVGGGGGGEVGFGPKNVCFHVKNCSMVEAVHSARLSHIILATGLSECRD